MLDLCGFGGTTEWNPICAGHSFLTSCSVCTFAELCAPSRLRKHHWFKSKGMHFPQISPSYPYPPLSTIPLPHSLSPPPPPPTPPSTNPSTDPPLLLPWFHCSALRPAVDCSTRVFGNWSRWSGCPMTGFDGFCSGCGSGILNRGGCSFIIVAKQSTYSNASSHCTPGGDLYRALHRVCRPSSTYSMTFIPYESAAAK